MPGYLGEIYAPPGTYVRTLFESPISASLESIKIPVLIGTGNEILFQNALSVVRGSSSQADQRVPEEDVTGRAVVNILLSGEIILGDFNGVLTKFQVRNFPIVDGLGSGTTTNDRGAVFVTVNNIPVVVFAVDGAKGIVEITTAPQATDEVRVTYSFNREDTNITDDLSDQVTGESAVVRGEIGVTAITGTYEFVAGLTDTLLLTVDQEPGATITLPAGTFTASQVAALINGQSVGTLVATAFENNEGDFAVQLTADNDILIGAGAANGVLGFSENAFTNRNRTFFTFQGPIVDGTNGGVTTTDPSKVVVLVDGTQVVPTAVDGANRAVTLPYAPAAGVTVVVTYYFNTWQDTFDYLGHTGITDISRVGITSNRSDFIDGVDFILKDDLIVWGTAALVGAGTTTPGSTLFGSTQVSTTLVDNKTFLEEATPVVDTSVIPATDDRRMWRLPFVPTTGNGRSTPLDQDLFITITNSRVDLPTNRPDLIQAYWGFSVQDALDRGPVTVAKVDASNATIILQDAVPVGARVFASFYYNILEDNEYTLTVVTPGSAGFGTYDIQDKNNVVLFDAQFGAKSAGLAGITVQFPRGSELFPDSRIEGNSSSLFEGPVEEVVTVTFATRGDTPAKFSVPGPDPYYPIASASDRARIQIDGADLASGAAGLDVSDPTGVGGGFFASLIGDEVVYDPDTGGATYEITALNNEVSLTVDGILLTSAATLAPGSTLDDFANAINAAALVVGSEPRYVAATRFTSPFLVTAAEYDKLTLHYTGDVSGLSGNHIITLTPGTYNSVTALVVDINIQLAVINAGILLLGTVTCFANAAGQLVFELTSLGAGDSVGFLDFVDNAAPAADFAIVAGIDTAAATAGTQTKLYNGPIARRFTVGAAPLEHDRLILRNRIVPGSGSIAPFHNVEQTELLIQGAGDPDFTGLASGQRGLAAFQATVQPATILGPIGFSDGQATGNADAQDGQPAIVFYDGTGVNPANNVFKVTFDGAPVTVVFISSGTGTATAMGPGSIVGTVLEQIADAMSAAGLGATAAAVLAAGLVRPEGAGIRFTSALTSLSSRITIGAGSANSRLGFVEGTIATRSNVDVRELASALMSHHAAAGAFVTTYLLDFATPAATYFAAEALASYVVDSLGAEFLYIQSQTLGVASSVVWAAATADDILLPGTGLLVIVGSGEFGEAGISGFFVTSSDPVDGSGTVDTSVLNSGIGQDGVVGQTYRDQITGLTFTVLPREGGSPYPVGSTFTFVLSKTFTADSNIPIRAIGGTETLVSNTAGTTVGDSAIIETFERGGAEPRVGDLYFVSYSYRKRDFDQKLFTKLSVIEANFGVVSPNNPVSLGAYLMFLNGAVTMGIKQVPKDAGEDTAGTAAYVTAVDELTKPFPGTAINPDILIPLKGDDVAFFQFLSAHLDVQSDIRLRNERTAICGLSPLIPPEEAGDIAQLIAATRFRLVYPDAVTLTLTDRLGAKTVHLVEGFYLAAAVAAIVVDPARDVATPWTNRTLVGFDALGRVLDAVLANQVAVRGITVIEDDPPLLNIRQGLTTDMSTVLTQTPTVIQIVDDVAQTSRRVLRPFIGSKNLPGLLIQVETTLTSMFKEFIRAEIIRSFLNVSATPDPIDLTSANVEAFYAPVLPLLYLLLTYNLRSSI